MNPAWEAFHRTSGRGANLDVQAVLLDVDGNILASSDETDDSYASIATMVPAGTYYLAVTGVGSNSYSDYASQGMYFIGGSVTLASDPNSPPLAGFGYCCAGLDCSFSDTSSDGDGTIVARSWSFGDGQGSTATAPGHDYAAAGTYTVTLTVTDDDGAMATTTRAVTATVNQGGQYGARFNFGGDGRADILIRNRNTSWVSLWEMDHNLATLYDIGELDPAWAVQ